MKRYGLLIAFLLLIMLLRTTAQVTVTVTNPANTTPNLAASYTSLANAVAAVNGITAMSGPVVLTCAAGSETAPLGGYNITPVPTSAANTITITTAGTVTLTAFTPQSSGSINDAVIKLTGSDYFVINGFTIKENPANTTTNAGTNNMTEFGIALLRNSTTDGAQHNTIQNNIISLNKIYTNTFGIYSNCRHAAATVTIASDITSVTGSNFDNRVYGNNISNVNYGIWFNGSATAAYMDNGNDIGGSSVATGNTITNWGQDMASASYADGTSNVCGILLGHQVNDNTSYNTVTSAAWSGTSLINAIYKFYPSGQPAGTFSSTISYNNVTITSSSALLTIVIQNSGITPALSTATINITNNTIQNCAINSGSASLTGIFNSSIAGTLNINGNIFKGNTSTATSGAFVGIQNISAVTSAINMNNNQLGIAGSGAVSFSAATISSVIGITNQGAGLLCMTNINNNSIDGISLVTCGTFQGIANVSTAATVNMNNNQLGSVTGNFVSFSGAQSGTVSGIVNISGSSSASLTIQGNDIKGIVNSVTNSCIYELIGSQAAMLSQTVSGNTFTNLTLNTTGGVYFIRRQGTMSSGASWNCNNNSIVTGFTMLNNPATLSFIYTNGTSGSGVTMNESNNNFSNVTISGTPSIFIGIYDQDGFGSGNCPTKTISGNTLNNINTGTTTSSILIWCNNVAPSSAVSSNTISNISGSGNIWGIQHNSNYGSGSFGISNNNISGISSTAGNVYGIYGSTLVSNPFNINGNTITGISTGNFTVSGIYIGDAALTNVYDNNINNITNSGTTLNATANGMQIGNISNTINTLNIYNNKIHTISATGALSTGSTPVNGILEYQGTNINIYNNFIANLLAPDVNLTDAIRGINLYAFTNNSSYNLYYNSVYINASSTGTNFGTRGIFHSEGFSATNGPLTMIDNIIVNTSTPKGTGTTVAFMHSGTTLNNYLTGSDYNLFYAGTPAANRLVYYDGVNSDQTMAAFQTRVAPREANSISLLPAFTSSTDLHLTSANCLLDNQGTPVAGITTDIDAATRDVSTPDIGADEFAAALNTTLAGVTGNAVCAYRNVSASGTTFSSNACDLIAKVTSSGANPVTGKINACVTLDATQQFFNAEPYVQRHYDIEPLSANTTTTSARITLYFTDAEFVQFNTLNPAWPKLPTQAGGGNADPNRANLRVTQYHGPSNNTPSNPTTYPLAVGGVLINPVDADIVWNDSYWAVTFDVTGFSGFYIHTNLYYPLAVSINYFHGAKQGAKHILDWKITCNTGATVTMMLERSNNRMGPFTAISNVTIATSACNQPFGYTDVQPLAGMNYYRLKLVDADGKISYSPIVALLNADKGFELISISPNPVNQAGSLKLNISSALAMNMEIVITDMAGRLVQRQAAAISPGYNTVPVNVSRLPAGNYQVYGNTGEGRSRVVRLVVQ